MFFVLTKLIFLLLLSCSDEIPKEGVFVKKISEGGVFIDVVLSTGVEIKNIKLSQKRVGKKWMMQVKKNVGTKVFYKKNKKLSNDEIDEFIKKIFVFIKNDRQGVLDNIHFDLKIFDTIWMDVESYLKSGVISSDYVLLIKDMKLSKLMSDYLSQHQLVKAICNHAKMIKKICKNKPVSMNPVAFKYGFVGKKWENVKKISGVGINTTNFWFGITLK